MTNDNPHKIEFNTFLDRQRDPNCRFTHWTIPDEEVLSRLNAQWDQQKPGYRPDVILVSITPDGFFCPVRELEPGDILRGTYEARREGEKPRKTLFYDCPTSPAEAKSPAVSVDVVLYSKAALAEDGQNIEGDWSIVAVNANPTEEEAPMDPNTMMANHFHDDGGTQTGMSAEEFEEALRKSYFHWRGKALIG